MGYLLSSKLSYATQSSIESLKKYPMISWMQNVNAQLKYISIFEHFHSPYASESSIYSIRRCSGFSS